MAARCLVSTNINTLLQALFLALIVDHSDDCLSALPISVSGLKLDDDVVRVAVSMRFDLDV